MRRTFFAVLLLWMNAALAGNETWGEHGMALFGGRDGLYAMHLPMFHPPHDYQVILQVHVAERQVDAELRQRLDGRTALWTVAPEKFELDRLAPAAGQPLRQFRADLVQGHFEQGGATQYRAATVIVDRVLLFRRLSPATHESAEARYLQVGTGRQRFLVKAIDSRPDFDHIVAYRAVPGASTDSITVPKLALTQPSTHALATALGVAPTALGGTVYFYTDDLR